MDRNGAALRDFVMEYGYDAGAAHVLDLAGCRSAGRARRIFSRSFFRKALDRFIAMLMAERRAAGKNADARRATCST